MTEPEQQRRLPVDFNEWITDPEVLPKRGMEEELEAIIAHYKPHIAEAKIVVLFNSQPKSEDK